MNTHLAKLVLWCLLILGLAILVLLPGRHVKNYYNVQSWEPVEAFIVSAKVTTHETKLPPQKSSGSNIGYRSKERSKSKLVTLYTPQSRFRYDYLDQSYVSITPTLKKGGSSDPEFSQALIAKLQAAQKNNSPVTAYVNPKNPGQAVIDRSGNWLPSLIGGILGALIIIVSGALLLFANHKT